MVQEYAIVLGRRCLHLCVHIFFSHFCVIADARSTAPQDGGGSPDGTNTVGAWLTFQNVGWVHDQMLDLLPIAVVNVAKRVCSEVIEKTDLWRARCHQLVSVRLLL